MKAHGFLQGVSQDAKRDQSKLRPVTVISTADGKLDEYDIDDEIKRFLAQDDVYSEDFAATVVIQMPTGVDKPVHLAPYENCDMPNLYLDYSSVVSVERLLSPSGPYFLHHNGIYEAWRLYPDTLDAFEIGVVPQGAPSAAK